MSTQKTFLSSLMTATTNALKSVQDNITPQPVEKMNSYSLSNKNTIKLIPSHKTYNNSGINPKSGIPLSSKLSNNPKLLEHYRNIYLNPNSK